MQGVPKDIDLLIHRLVHRDLTTQLNKEFHNRLGVCVYVHPVCCCAITVKITQTYVEYNWRNSKSDHVHIFNKCGVVCTTLPKYW